MSSLNASLNIAVQALDAATGSITATNNNIANANTPGYSRQVAVLVEATPTQNGSLSEGNGVELTGYQSVRNEVLQTLIEQQTTAQSGANAQLTPMQQIQPTFTTSTQDIGTEMSALFSSISSLSTTPSNSASRQAVLQAGQNLATAFNTASQSLTTQQNALNTNVTQDVSQINELTKQIAALNPQLAELKATGQDGGTLQDQQDELVLKLSALTSVSETQDAKGEATLTTGNGTTLVAGSQSYSLQTATGSDGMQHVIDQTGADITTSLTGGDLGGSIQMRDSTTSGIPSVLNQLDTLANQFGNAINAAQAGGYDQNGNAGQNFFTVSATIAGSAASIKMAITDPALIAASSDGTSGSNGNLASFSTVQNTALGSGQTPSDAYSSLVSRWAVLPPTPRLNPLHPPPVCCNSTTSAALSQACRSMRNPPI